MFFNKCLHPKQKRILVSATANSQPLLRLQPGMIPFGLRSSWHFVPITSNSLFEAAIKAEEFVAHQKLVHTVLWERTSASVMWLAVQHERANMATAEHVLVFVAQTTILLVAVAAENPRHELLAAAYIHACSGILHI